MPSTANQSFFQKIRKGTTSHFFPFDLHVHTPGSQDITVGSRYDVLPSELQQKLPHGSTKEKGPLLGDYDKNASTLVEPEFFLGLLEKQRTEVLTNLGWDKPDSSLCLIGLTDHNVFNYTCRVAKLAWDQFTQKRLLLLPGVELDVIFPIPGISGETRIHLLCHFSPSKQEHDIHQAITVANNNQAWSPGTEVEVSDLAAFVNALRNSKTHPAMCIAAHVSSSSGIQAEVTRAVREFTQRDAATVAQLSASEPSPFSHQKLQSIWADYPEPAMPETSLSLEHAALLSLLGQCGFDGLQVTCKEDQTHYRSLHRCGQTLGRSIPLIASDAHTPTAIFRCNGQVPFIKLPISLANTTDPDEIFRIIRNECIRFGETRTTFCVPERASTWISGIEVTKSATAPDASSFWPVYTPAPDLAPDGHCTLSFSRNLNCIIGGRGSGKSALIEALAFVTNPKTLESSQAAGGRSKIASDSESRALATLKGTTVRICWQSLHDPSFASLEKKAKFVTRYFDPAGRHSSIRVENLDGSEIVAASGSLPSVHLFRFKDIEQAAQPDHLRRMFDAIQGDSVQRLTESIEADIKTLKNQRKEIVFVASDINKLTLSSQSPLRQYVRRKQQFDSVNTAAAKAEFEKIDKASALHRSGINAAKAWEQIAPDTQMEESIEEIERFANSHRQKLLNGGGSVIQGADELAALLDKTSADSPMTMLLSSMEETQTRTKTVTQKLDEFASSAEINLKTTNDEASKKGIVVVTNAREVNRKSFEEASTNLETYRDLIEKMKNLMKARKLLFDGVREKCIERSRIRQETATGITNTLAGALDRNVLVIKAEAQERHDTADFQQWLLRSGGINYAREARIEKLLEAKLLPDQLREALLAWDGVTSGNPEAVGAVRSVEAKIIDDFLATVQPMTHEKELAEVVDENSFPPEIIEGLIIFNLEASNDFFNLILELDEILIDDRPVILLNDRPAESGSKPRPLEELSPGQRCSAILPILLATGDGPLIIDQPEDNLDTRLIRQVIVNILANIKLKRQVIMATHNPNIPVLGDAEQTIILRAVEDKRCSIDGYGDLGSKSVVHYITDIMEGGREAFQYRAEVYQPYWTSI